MPLYRFSELKAWLDSHGLSPKKGLSQNFLIDGNIVEKILSKIPATPHPIIEIGPGPGVLTEALYERGQRLFLIEADSSLTPHLQRFEPFEIYEGDALKIDPQAWLSKRINANSKASVVSNLPYHLSTPFFKKWLMIGPWVDRLVIMVQKEFAQRLLAKPGDDAYCPLSIYAHHYIASIESFDVPSSCFYPAPKVTSTVLHITLNNKEPNYRVKEILEHLFNQRRKLLSGVAKRKGWKPLEEPLNKHNLERIEQMSPEALWNVSTFFSNPQ
jgi:16S rRNA (adenine1518-N6/adenine1519-N6)-dimethyltransferase